MWAFLLKGKLMLKQLIANQKARRVLPLVPHPLGPIGAQGVDSSLLIWHHDQLKNRFVNPFQTIISVVDWSHDGSILLAGSVTGEVLAWRFETGERLLDNRNAHSYAPIVGVSWSPEGEYLVAVTMARTIQIWRVETRTCLVLPCQGNTQEIIWKLDGNGFRTNDGVVWNESEGGDR
jgi:WD40 repeat protein